MSQTGSSGVPGFNWFKHRTGGLRCQTSSLLMSQSRLSRTEIGEEIKKEKMRETTWSIFLFLGSTDPAAKERLFLERFTCFQQG
jgi:hypothetical protein